MTDFGAGVLARGKRPLTAAAVAGLAGLSAHGAAHAAGAAETAMATAAPAGTVSQIDVTGARRHENDIRVTAPPLNNPQTVTVVPRGVIAAQNLLSLREILSVVPGITFGAGEGGGGFGDSINLRGYTATNDITLDNVRDGAQYTRSDPFNIEQIEVINGANSVYSGAGAVGGTINIVSKRPTRGDTTLLQGGVGTENYWRGAVDTNQRLSHAIAVRLNAMVHRNDAPGRDVERFRRWGIAPSVSIGMGGPTKLTLMYVHQEDRNTPQYGTPFYNARPLPGVDPGNYYGYANIDAQDQDVDIATAILDHSFGGGLKLHALTRYQKVWSLTDVDAPQGTWCLANGQKPVAFSQTATTSSITGFAPCAAGDPAPGFYQPSGPRGRSRDADSDILFAQIDLNWDGVLAGMRHTLTVGVAAFEEDYRLRTGELLRTATGAAVALPPMNIATPDTNYAGPVNYIPTSVAYGERSNQAVYAFDNIVLNPRWSINGGVRYERNDGSNRTDAYNVAPGPALGAVTPGRLFPSRDNLFSYRLGLVYKPVANASLYAAYGDSATPSQASVAAACTEFTCNLAPEKGETFEIGAKYDYRNRLSATIALFRNDRTNYRVATNDPQFALGSMTLDGSARVEGVALGLTGKVTAPWAVFANYTYLTSKVLRGTSRFNAGQGLDVTRGDALLGVPDHAFSLFTTYDLPHGVQIGYGVTYQGRYYLSQHAVVAGTTNVRSSIPLVRAKAYSVHRLTVAWEPTDSVELRINVNNLFDKIYYTRARTNLAGWATPGDRRNATATVSYRF